MQAVADSPIKGTQYTAAQSGERYLKESNYNSHGMVHIDYDKPGAQQFINW